MKKHLLTFIGILSIGYSYGQKIEVNLQANTGLFRYSGSGTTSNSFINVGTDESNNYVNNPYGNNNTISYGFGVQAQAVTSIGFIFGLQTGYDILRSRMSMETIPRAYPANALPPDIHTSGDTYLTKNFININPYIGYRLVSQKVKLDLLPGLEFGLNVHTHEKGTAKEVNNTASTISYYQVDEGMRNTSKDVRVKLGLNAYYNKFGIFTSLAYGLTNYEEGLIGGPTLYAHSKLLRIGISYRVN